MLRPSKTGQSTCIAAIMTWKSPFARTRAQEINWQYHTIPISKPCIASNILRQQLDWDFSAILCDNWNFVVQPFLANVSNCFKLVHVNPSVQSPSRRSGHGMGTAAPPPQAPQDPPPWHPSLRTEYDRVTGNISGEKIWCFWMLREKKTKQLQHVATMSSKIDYNIQLQGKSNMLYYSVFCCRVLTFFLQTPSCSMFQVLTCQSSSCAKWSINYPQQNLCLCACIILDSLSKAMVSWCLLTVEGCIYIGSTT